MQIPLNRIVAFAGPYISLAAGVLAAWLVAKLNVLGLPGLGSHQHELATGIAAGATALLAAGLSHLGQMKWLRGVHIELANSGAVQVAALMPAPAPAQLMGPPDAIHAEEAELLASGVGVSDEEEFASPPPDEMNVPVQPSQVTGAGGLST